MKAFFNGSVLNPTDDTLMNATWRQFVANNPIAEDVVLGIHAPDTIADLQKPMYVAPAEQGGRAHILVPAYDRWNMDLIRNDQPLMDTIAQAYGVDAGALTNDQLKQFALLHEAGHSVELHGRTQSEAKRVLEDAHSKAARKVIISGGTEQEAYRVAEASTDQIAASEIQGTSSYRDMRSGLVDDKIVLRVAGKNGKLLISAGLNPEANPYHPIAQETFDQLVGLDEKLAGVKLVPGEVPGITAHIGESNEIRVPLSNEQWGGALTNIRSNSALMSTASEAMAIPIEELTDADLIRFSVAHEAGHISGAYGRSAEELTQEQATAVRDAVDRVGGRRTVNEISREVSTEASADAYAARTVGAYAPSKSGGNATAAVPDATVKPSAKDVSRASIGAPTLAESKSFEPRFASFIGVAGGVIGFLKDFNQGMPAGQAAAKAIGDAALYTMAPWLVGVKAAYAAGKTVGKIPELTSGLREIVDISRSVNFGGQFTDTRAAATMRQAGIRAIQAQQLNARFVLGQEGRLMNRG